jgi:hypothetical protein
VRIKDIRKNQKLDELNLSHVIGNYGSAAAKQIGNRLTGDPEGQMSVKDKMSKEKFLRDFIGRASSDIDSLVKSGQIVMGPAANDADGDGKPDSGAAGATAAGTASSGNAGSTQAGSTVDANSDFAGYGAEITNMATDKRVLDTLAALKPEQLVVVKKLLTQKAKLTAEQIDEASLAGLGQSLKAGAGKLGAGLKAGAQALSRGYQAVKPYAQKAGQAVAQVPRLAATGAGAAVGGARGMGTAARKGYQAGVKYVGRGPLSFDELQKIIYGAKPDQAKQLLQFIKQLQTAQPKQAKPAAPQATSQAAPQAPQAAPQAAAAAAPAPKKRGQPTLNLPAQSAPTPAAGATASNSITRGKDGKLAVKGLQMREDILSEADTISSYLQRWIPQYVGFDTSRYNDQINQLSKDVQNTWRKDGGKQALTKLANLMFALSYSESGKGAAGAAKEPEAASTDSSMSAIDALRGRSASTPAASSAASGAEAGAAPAADLAASSEQIINLIRKMTGRNMSDDLVEIINIALTRLRLVDRAAYTQMMKDIKSGTKEKRAAAPAAPVKAATPKAAPKAKPKAPAAAPATTAPRRKPNLKVGESIIVKPKTFKVWGQQ